MAITSPYNSFVEFNELSTDCRGEETRVRLPVFGHLGIKFQFKEDGLIPTDTIFKAAVCSSNCELIYNPNYQVVPVCSKQVFMVNTAEEELSVDHFPLLVGNYAPQPGQPQIPEGEYTYQAFIDIINEYYETYIPGLQFSTCCEAPEISGIVVFLNGQGIAKDVSLISFYDTGHVDFPETPMDGIVDIDECFRYCILNSSNEVLACSNLFYRTTDNCYTTLFRYYNEENAYGFKYTVYDDSGTDKITENTIRLPVNFSRPQFPIQETVFRQPNGIQQRLSTIIEKEWFARTGYLDNAQHEKLIVMLKHDYLHVQNEPAGINYRMTHIGEYQVNYPEIDTPTAPAEFQINDYSNNNVNNNCGFECGIEFSPDCDGGGSVIVPCPPKFNVEFTGSSGQLEPGNLVYQNDSLIGKQSVEVYREGLLQHNSGPNNIVFNSTTGEITFTPAVDNAERIAIWEV